MHHGMIGHRSDVSGLGLNHILSFGVVAYSINTISNG
jgi:hypothetical protein